jgi:DNA-directed RNA polymerase subunit H (RpoH/RPB5)
MTMNEIQKITRSRETLKEILGMYDWDTSAIPTYSEKEIEALYSQELSKNSPLSTMGIAAPCTFKVPHKEIDGYNLHIIYYNFPELGKRSSKVTKSISDKIVTLYSDEAFGPDDSLFIIINDPVTETVQKIIDTLNIRLKDDYELSLKNHNLGPQHFKNIFIFDIRMFVTNLMNHEIVPQYRPIRDSNEIESILQKNNATLRQMPIIHKNDNIGKMLRLVPGDLCEITRSSQNCGEYTYYRVCR